jgi:hypothetical protein
MVFWHRVPSSESQLPDPPCAAKDLPGFAEFWTRGFREKRFSTIMNRIIALTNVTEKEIGSSAQNSAGEFFEGWKSCSIMKMNTLSVRACIR